MNYEDRVTKEYVEDALANAGVKMVTGTYTGDGTAMRTFSVGFTPKAVLLMYNGTHCSMGFTSNTQVYGGLALTDHPITAYGTTCLEIVSGGFRVRSATKIYLNDLDYTFFYVALG